MFSGKWVGKITSASGSANIQLFSRFRTPLHQFCLVLLEIDWTLFFSLLTSETLLDRAIDVI